MKTVLTFEIIVHRYNEYGDRVVEQTPASVVANDLEDVQAKVRAIFAASYDDFRKFWSHTYTLVSVTESPVPACENMETGE